MGRWLRIGGAVAARPRLWSVALRQLIVLAPHGWWRSLPPVPTPDPAYLEFRAATQYGDPHHGFEADDVVTYLDWCRRYRKAVL